MNNAQAKALRSQINHLAGGLASCLRVRIVGPGGGHRSQSTPQGLPPCPSPKRASTRTASTASCCPRSAASCKRWPMTRDSKKASSCAISSIKRTRRVSARESRPRSDRNTTQPKHAKQKPSARRNSNKAAPTVLRTTAEAFTTVRLIHHGNDDTCITGRACGGHEEPDNPRGRGNRLDDVRQGLRPRWRDTSPMC